MHSHIVAARPRRNLPVMAAWGILLLLASALALRVGDVVRGGSDGVPGSESIEAVDAAVAAGVPAGTFYPFIAVLHADGYAADDPQFAAVRTRRERSAARARAARARCSRCGTRAMPGSSAARATRRCS